MKLVDKTKWRRPFWVSDLATRVLTSLAFKKVKLSELIMKMPFMPRLYFRWLQALVSLKEDGSLFWTNLWQLTT